METCSFAGIYKIRNIADLETTDQRNLQLGIVAEICRQYQTTQATRDIELSMRWFMLGEYLSWNGDV